MQTLTPFEETLTQFCEALSKALFAEGELHPELTALAFWLRKSQIESLRDRFRSLERAGERIVPRGVAFHIAPANVETLFVYSWILSLLVGNANVVRLPSRQSPATSLLLVIVQNLLHRFDKIAQSTQLLSYGHEEEVTAAISKEADVRLIWGGDATVATIRKIPLKIAGKDLVFPDRYAFAAFRSPPEPELFFRDLFWYDQRTCASPRTLFWLGAKYPEEFYKSVAEVAKKRGYELPLSARLNKMTEIYRAALELPVTGVVHFGPLSVVSLEQFVPACRNFGGDGLLFHVAVPSVDPIAEMVIQKDQTLVHHGLSEQELEQLALSGKGLDRIVPVGSALQFSEVWDGYDLLVELTKRVVVHE